MYYNSVISYNNMTYSIDMIRLKTYITYNKFSEIEFRFDTIYSDYVSKKYTSNKMKEFFFNYNIEIEEGKSFYFAFLHNTEKRKTDEKETYNFTIEFNPNKLKDNPIINYLLNISGDWYIRSYDLAVDLKINILDILIDKGKKRKFQFYSNGGDDITYRIGVGDGKVKIYNKKKESKLDINGELTRIEISRQYDDFPVRDIKLLKYGTDYFPELYINNYIYSLSDYQDKTLLAIIYAVQLKYPINELSRSYKEKIKKLFEGGQKIKFTDKDATEVLRKTIFSYFMKNEKVRWR